jgi:hypothetical protein
MWATLPADVRQDIDYDHHYRTRGAAAWVTANDLATDMVAREIAGDAAAACHSIIAGRSDASLRLIAKESR